MSTQVGSQGYSQVLAEVGASEEGSRSYVYGQEHLPLAQLGGRSGAAFFHGDYLGTTRQLTGPAGDAWVSSPANYSPFGDSENAALSSLTSMAYTGQYIDSAMDLQYHRARWLSTEKGRWLSEDPVFDFPANFGNRYGYVGGGLANARDISGKFTLAETTVGQFIFKISSRAFLVPLIQKSIVFGAVSGGLLGYISGGFWGAVPFGVACFAMGGLLNAYFTYKTYEELPNMTTPGELLAAELSMYMALFGTGWGVRSAAGLGKFNKSQSLWLQSLGSMMKRKYMNYP